MEIIDVIEADMAKFSHARLHIPRHCKIHHDEVMIEIHRPDVLLFQGKIRLAVALTTRSQAGK